MPSLSAGYLAVFTVGIALRVLISWVSAWGESLIDVLEFATPLDRLDLLRELHAIFRFANASPQDIWGSLTQHHSPLLLLLPTKLILDPFLSAVAWIAVDVLTAVTLAKTAEILRSRSKNKAVCLSPVLVAACFLLNPYAIAACVAKSMSQVRTCLIMVSLLSAIRGSSRLLVLSHVLNSILFFTPIMFTPIFALLGSDSYADYGSWRSKFGLRRVDAWYVFLRKFVWHASLLLIASLFASYLLSGDPNGAFVRSVYGSRFLADDLTPTIGLFWYFFVEMFSHFFSFFVMVVHVHMWIYTIPVLLKYRTDLVFGLTILLGVQCLFEAYPCVGDTAAFLAIWSLSYGRLADYLRYPMVSFMLFAYTTLLFPVFRYLWMYAGSANANFYYAINLVHGMGIASVILDAVWAWGRERWEDERHIQEAPKDLQGSVRLIVQQ